MKQAPINGLRGSAALLGLSVLADSGIEHSRGRFRNRGMYAPPLISGLLIRANLRAMGGAGSPSSRDGLHAIAAIIGVAGAGFHAWNILHRPGALSWHNLFYAAPIGAPAALALAGLIGLAADHVRVNESAKRATLAGLPAGRLLSALAAGGLAGTVAEVSLLHFRGNFQSPFMWVPLALPPVAAVLLVKASVSEPRSRPLATQLWLGATAAVGLAGSGFHARGIARMMGGWRNWTQNLFDGPPLPAPPSFTALALAGLSALALNGRANV